MYADVMTDSIKFTISETDRRRKIQEQYNIDHDIVPASIQKDIVDIIEREYLNENRYLSLVSEFSNTYRSNNAEELKAAREAIRKDMLEAADNLEFEKAAVLRDQMIDIEQKLNVLGKTKK
jgi:excinuclease ABC subunit B